MFKGRNTKDADLVVSSDGNTKPTGKFKEIGTIGLNAYAGMIQEAYNSELYWPQCIPLYSRLWSSDPEVVVVRNVLSAMSMEQRVEFKLHPSIEKPTTDDELAIEFGNEVLNDIEGGVGKWFTSAMTRVPFYGWGWWEAVPGIRIEDWKPPDKDDPWRSDYNDGLVGYRRLAFRRYKSFYAWDQNESTGRLYGMEQYDIPNDPVKIPLDSSLHITFGDSDNPEGLATFEALWRLERIKYSLELIMGIGFEHTAGYVSFTAKEELTPADKVHINAAARAVTTAQAGNYLALPDNIEAAIVDAGFQSAEQLMDAIKYYGILKLALLGMQWAAMGTLSPYGSYSSVSDASEFFLTIYNSMSYGFIQQADEQIGKRLFEFEVNKATFPDMTRRPVLTVTKAEKTIKLDELGSLMTALSAIIPMGDDDLLAVRKKTGFLPEELPQDGEIIAPVEEKVEKEAEESVTPENEPEEVEAVGGEEEEKEADLASRRPFVVGEDEHATTTEQDAYITEKDVAGAVRRFTKWANENDPDLLALLNAEPIFPPDETEVLE